MATKKPRKKAVRSRPAGKDPHKIPKKKETNAQVIAAEERATALARRLRQPETWMKIRKIASLAEFKNGSEVLAWCREFKAQCEKERKELVTPLNGVVKKINARFKTITGPADKIADHVSGLLSDYDAAQRAKETKKIEKEAAKAEAVGDTEFAADLRDNAVRTKPDLPLEGMAARDHWHAEITDLGAALVAFMEGHPALQGMRGEILGAIERHASRVAAAVKREEIGIPGCKGVRTTTFVRKG